MSLLVATRRALLVPQAAASYVGPFDGLSFAALYGFVRLLTSYTGPLFSLRRDSDDALADIGYNAVTGNPDAAAVTAHLSGANGFAIPYDQSGNGRNLAQATTTKQPAYLASGINSLPCMDLDGTDDVLVGSATFNIGAAVAVANYEDGATFGNYDGLLTTSDVNLFIGDGAGSNDLYTENSSAYPFHGAYRHNGTLGVDLGTLATAKIISGIDATPADGVSAIRIGQQLTNGSRFWGGKVAVIGISTTAWSAAEHNQIGNALASLYAITWNTVS